MGIEEDIHTLPTWLEVDLDALLRNLDVIRKRLRRREASRDDVRIMLSVKADAYGHGAVHIAGAAAPVVDMFGVATVEEAIELADAGIDTGILILSPIMASEIEAAVARGFAVTVSSLRFADDMSRAAQQLGREAAVHIEFDTGMGRTGFLADELEAVARHVAARPGLRLAGLYTHFPVSDSDAGFTREQVREFLAAVDRLEGAGIHAPLHHAANSGAVANVPESHLHMVRPGLAVYGCHPGADALSLGVRPVMTWKCRLVQVRRIPAGRSISYNRTFSTKRLTVMGVLPVGYGHGYPFRLSNCGQVLVGGTRAPILGRVTMDMTMVDLTDVEPAPQPGDDVVLIGQQGRERITAEEVADWAGTIAYEVLTGVGRRVARAYRRDGRVTVLKTMLGTRTAGTP